MYYSPCRTGYIPSNSPPPHAPFQCNPYPLQYPLPLTHIAIIKSQALTLCLLRVVQLMLDMVNVLQNVLFVELLGEVPGCLPMVIASPKGVLRTSLTADQELETRQVALHSSQVGCKVHQHVFSQDAQSLQYV